MRPAVLAACLVLVLVIAGQGLILLTDRLAPALRAVGWPWNDPDLGDHLALLVILAPAFFVSRSVASRLERRLVQLRTALDHSADVAITDASGRIIYVNDRFCRLSGYSRQELLGKTHRIVSSDRHPAGFFQEMWQTIRSGRVWRGEVCNKAKDGSLFWEDTTITPIAGADGAPREYVAIRHDITQRMRALQALADSEESQRMAAEAAQLGTWVRDTGTGEAVWSARLRKILGVSPDASATYAALMSVIHPEDRGKVEQIIGRGVRRGERFTSEYRIVWPDGTIRWVCATGRAVAHESGGPTRTFGVVQDITERKAAEARLAETEARLRQSQKMEGIGRLAGGIAHDFNNLLTAIAGYSHLLLDQFAPDDPRRADIDEIRKAGERAAALTGQLLAFSRRQRLNPALLDVNAVIADLERMLGRIIGEDIELVFKPGRPLGAVLADRGQLEQVITNLVVNAKDAMPSGGRLTIETSNEDVHAVYALTNPESRPGPHVLISIGDTGCGISDEVKAHLFEPFFTTKEQGKGTGLGLATVYGIVRQSRGDIYVDSAPGAGATFKIRLPRASGEAPSSATPSTNEAAGGTETILLVEDDAIVHRFAARVLRRSGYKVLATRRPEDALRICSKSSAPISLMLTDLVMPVMHGYALAERVRKLRPEAGFAFMSGYAENSLVPPAGLETAPLIPKPLTAERLLSQVRSALDARAVP